MTAHDAMIALLRTMQRVGAETVTLRVSKGGERTFRVKTRRPVDVRDFYAARLEPQDGGFDDTGIALKQLASNSWDKL